MIATVCSTLFAHFSLSVTYAFCTFGPKRCMRVRAGYVRVNGFVKMIYSVTVLWAGIFLFSLLWRCKVVLFEQFHTRFLW